MLGMFFRCAVQRIAYNLACFKKSMYIHSLNLDKMMSICLIFDDEYHVYENRVMLLAPCILIFIYLSVSHNPQTYSIFALLM